MTTPNTNIPGLIKADSPVLQTEKLAVETEAVVKHMYCFPMENFAGFQMVMELNTPNTQHIHALIPYEVFGKFRESIVPGNQSTKENQ